MQFEESNHRNFLWFGLSFEFGLGVIGLLGCWLCGVNLLSQWEISATSLLWGVVATLPMLLLLVGMELWPTPPVVRIKDFIYQTLGPMFARCHPLELLLLAISAGIGEELLFRGFVQQSLEGFGYWPALVIASILFGIVHAVTPTYAVLAALMGFYFGYLLDATGERNLWVPVIAHGLYDWLAFLWIAHEVKKRDKLRIQEDFPSPETAEVLSEQELSVEASNSESP
ncbi:CPBP family intramembrane glutamic endopeptidase [Calycomorphotria hydatis]|uniref:CAAX amino terminal protease self-immunity n=1 Tax=Calycomorphotria hydatis TaxID=2528027 RepID=A0A517TAZ8_9PLAN|nr:CPBP family intramembrane glutamic endopeptidase [Calycomorphotria hydatis]QDT65544.1 CAAX amino terminal protease self- immunity [Calycomorphotria hydatis]